MGFAAELKTKRAELRLTTVHNACHDLHHLISIDLHQTDMIELVPNEEMDSMAIAQMNWGRMKYPGRRSAIERISKQPC